jgi:hypothetical protein
MSIHTQLQAAMEQRDADKWIELYHEDYQFIRHQSGTSMDREQMYNMVKVMMASDAVVQHSPRCIYENDEVLVDHVVMDFPDGTTEAVLGVHTIQEGKIMRTETGATLINK